MWGGLFLGSRGFFLGLDAESRSTPHHLAFVDTSRTAIVVDSAFGETLGADWVYTAAPGLCEAGCLS